MLIALAMPGNTYGVVDVTKEELDTLHSVLSRIEPAVLNYDSLNQPRFAATTNYRVPVHIEFVLPHDWKSRQQIRDEEEAAKRQVDL
jgi:hypothetical protein